MMTCNLKFYALGIFLLAVLCHTATPVEEELIIGIDLGTTYSVVGVQKDGRVQIIPNDQGSRITPSYVAFTDNERLIGDAAKNQAAANPERTVFDAKRLIGRIYSDPTVQHDKKMFPFKLVDKQGKIFIEVRVGGETKQYAPEEISAMVLIKMKETAENFLGKTVKKAVVTVPAYFNDAQRQATKDACTIAGLDCVRIINEPTAAALAYGLHKKKEQIVLVFDLGGGTFDVSILQLDNGAFQVLATNGDTHLGGEDFDQRVMQYFITLIKQKYKQDISKDQHALGKLKRECEKAKRALSTLHQVQVEIEGLLKDGTDFSATLTRAKFEELNKDLFQKTIGPVTQVLEDAGLKKSEIDEVVLVGGSTRIPKVQKLIQEYFGKEPNRGVNPDEAVAYGAAVQGAILAGAQEYNELVLLDVTPLSLGIETVGGVFAKIINRNTVIPVKKSQVFTTTHDNQDHVETKVYQGERPMTKDNLLLGSFDLTGIPPAPRGVPQIEVTFEIDANGITHVKAEIIGVGKTNSITIKADKGRLSEQDIARMLKEAEEAAEEDKKSKAAMDARQQLESYAFSLRTSVNSEDQWGGKISEENKEVIEEAVAMSLSWLDENPVASVDDYREKQKELEETANPIITELYSTYGSPKSEGGRGKKKKAAEHEERDEEDDYADEEDFSL